MQNLTSTGLAQNARASCFEQTWAIALDLEEDRTIRIIRLITFTFGIFSEMRYLLCVNLSCGMVSEGGIAPKLTFLRVLRIVGK